MPTIQEVIDRLMDMRKDLTKTNEEDLLENEYTMKAWIELSNFVQNKKKDKLKDSFEYLENHIHREFRIPPAKLLQRRKIYASGKEFILSMTKSDRKKGVVPNWTVSRPHTIKIKRKQEESQTKHLPRRYSPSGSYQDNDGAKLRHIQQDYDEMERQLKDTHEQLQKAERDNEYSVERGKMHHLQQRYEERERKLKDTQAKSRQSETDKEYLVDRNKFQAHQTSTGDSYPNDVCQAQVARADTKEWKYEQKIERLKRELKDTQATLRQAQMDKERFKDKMSKMTEDKLTHTNPVMADLCDPKRPQKLAEKYGELYDNEWTDANDKLNPRNEAKHERACIDIQSAILKFCYSECERIADSQLSQLEMDCYSLQTPYAQQGKPPEGSEAIKRFLLDAQHSSSMFTMRAAVDSVKVSLTMRKELSDKAKHVLPYTEKCIEICWSMVTHHPRIFLLWPDVSKKEKIRFDMFLPYTRSGDTVEYVVWPAMLLYKDGPLLRKGTVQPVAR